MGRGAAAPGLLGRLARGRGQAFGEREGLAFGRPSCGGKDSGVSCLRFQAFRVFESPGSWQRAGVCEREGLVSGDQCIVFSLR